MKGNKYIANKTPFMEHKEEKEYSDLVGGLEKARKNSRTEEQSLENMSLQNMIEEYRFKPHKDRLTMHFSFLILLLCVVACENSRGHAIGMKEVICISVMLLGQCIDLWLSRSHYKKKQSIMRISKLTLMASVLIFSAGFNFTMLSVVAGLTVFISYTFEYLQCIDLSDSDEKDWTVVLICILFGIIFVPFSLVGKYLNYVQLLLLVGIFCAGSYSIIKELCTFLNVYMTYITRLNNQSTELKESSEKIHEQSVKIKEAIDLLGKQKIQLTKMNETIELRNHEMNVHNEVLSVITAEKDMAVISNKVDGLLVDQEYVDVAAIYIDALMYGNSFPMVDIKGVSEPVSTDMNQNAMDVLKEVHLFDDEYDIVTGAFSKLYKPLAEDGIRAMMRMQIITDGGMCGVLLLGSKERNYFDDEELIPFYTTIATQLGIAVKNANLYSTMENLATRDGLTGIFNRRHFTKLFNDYVTTAIESKLPIAVALFDIDKFKNVNDTYGHSFGDRVIVSVAQTANRVVTDHGGILGRYGGEEFVMAFLNSDVDSILPIVKDIHEQIKQEELLHNGTVVKINVSIGVTDYPNTCSNPADLLNHADWAMYYSKQHGRGRITVDSSEVRLEM